MSEDERAAQIAQLEAEIERLAEVAESCRKMIVAARVAVGAGGIGLAATVLGAISFDQLVFLASIAGILGGVVVIGSNTTTLRQARADMVRAEARRSQLIGQIEFPVVIDGGREGR